MSVEAKHKSFDIHFETLFAKETVEIKDAFNVKLLSEVHKLLMANGELTDTALYEYCTNLWAFVEFVRANRKLETTVPLDWLVRNLSCNCYWWEVLCRCNQFADRILARDFNVDSADTRTQLDTFKLSKAAIGLLYKVQRECLPAWKDRGTAPAFALEITKETKECDENYRKLRMRVLAIGARIVELSADEQLKAAQMYATLYQLSGKTDEMALRKGLLARSRHCNSIAEYGLAIALAQAYEKLAKDVSHPYLAQWAKDNDACFRHPVPPALDPGEALKVVGTSTAYEQGTPPPRRTLYALLPLSKATS